MARSFVGSMVDGSLLGYPTSRDARNGLDRFGLWPAPKPGQSCPEVLPALICADMATWSRSPRLLQLFSVRGRGKGSALGLVSSGVSRRLTEWLYVKDRHGGTFLSETYNSGWVFAVWGFLALTRAS